MRMEVMLEVGTNGSVGLGSTLLPPKYGKDVLLIFYPAVISSSVDGVESDKGTICSISWQICQHTTVPVDHDKNIVGLLTGSFEVEYPTCETPHQASMFINQFMDIKSDFPPGEFQALGWAILRTSIGGPRWWSSSLKI